MELEPNGSGEVTRKHGRSKLVQQIRRFAARLCAPREGASGSWVTGIGLDIGPFPGIAMCVAFRGHYGGGSGVYRNRDWGQEQVYNVFGQTPLATVEQDDRDDDDVTLLDGAVHHPRDLTMDQ
ncbi:hypothetical protein GGI09_000738 [Coemansia sp. S100]|nr:hypothetical protein GGI09_000738 [Coemansia sp. S100]